MSKPLETMIKEYPERGPLKQYRFEKSISFNCFRCGQSKISKLITIYNNDWTKRLCNGCYGALLSIHEIKSGSKTTDEKSEELLRVLLHLANDDLVKQQANKILLKENQARLLTTTSLRFFATSEFVATTLTKEDNLDWSPAVIGLCKAFELEIAEKFLNILKETCKSLSLTDTDIKDKDFGRIASYCSGKAIKSPELGAVSHFLTTAINSKDRLDNSEFLKNGFKVFLSRRPNSNWLINKDGLAKSIDTLTKNYRNKAAHTDELGASHYENCKELVFGDNGIMWALINSTKTIKSG